MGNKGLSPNNEKLISFDENELFQFVNCEMQGWRERMEDASIFNLQFEDKMALFATFDGHGGPLISKFVAANFEEVLSKILRKKQNLHNDSIQSSLIETFLKFDEFLLSDKVNDMLRDFNLALQNGAVINKNAFKLPLQSTKFESPTHLSFKVGNSNETHFKCNSISLGSTLESSKEEDTLKNSSIEVNSLENSNSNSSEISKKAQYQTDDKREKRISKMIKEKKQKELVAKNQGTTANVCLIYGKKIFVANVGDSLTVMFKNKKAIRLNVEHKTCIEEEKQRVINAGLTIKNERVNGILNMTRAIGDFCFKNTKFKPYEQAVTAYPEINIFDLTDDIEFIITACDGIWDGVDEQKLCEDISLRIKRKQDINILIEEIFDIIVSKTGQSSFFI